MKNYLLLLLLIPGTVNCVMAQTREITGLVVDQTNRQPIANASILLKGSRQATATNAAGKFSLTVPDRNNLVLVASCIGYQQTEINAGQQQQLNITLAVAESKLNEVVVTIGYGTVKRRSLTGAVSSVTAAQLKDIPVNSAAQALAGRLAGVQVTTAEGSPDADVNIKIRGGGSITQDNSPLYIIDGVQVENGLSGLSPQDIATIDVLKDAASTAIYGARGSNGVVLITTKGGKEMKTIVSYNGFAGINKLANKLPVMNPYDFVIYQYERSRAMGTGDAFDQEYGTWDQLDKYKTTPFVDWQEKTYGRNAFSQSHNIGVTGGNKTTQFNLSLTSNQQEGIILNSDYNRKLVNFRFDHSVNQKLKIGFNFRYNDQLIKGAGTSDKGAFFYNMLRHAVKYRPFDMEDNTDDEILDEDYYNETNTGQGLGILNPIALNNAQYRKNRTKISNISGYLNYTILKNLSFRSTLGVDYNNNELQSFDDAFAPISRTNGNQPMAGIVSSNTSTFNMSNVLTYTPAFKKHHTLNVLLGNEFYNLKNTTLSNRLKMFPTGIQPEIALSQLSLGTNMPLSPSTTSAESKIISFFNRTNYSYDDKYLLTFTLRADGSSKFSSANRWGYFPSAAIAWRLSEENFMKSLTFISDLKVRLSYGQAGNNRINDYLYMPIFNSNGFYALNEQIVPGYKSVNFPNKDLKWETTISRNLGLDVSLFKDRLQLTVDLYRNTTNNLLITAPIPTTSGYATQLQNVGSTLNKGVEFQVSAAIMKQRAFSWNADFNISFNNNSILQLAKGQSFYYANSGVGPSGQGGDYIVQVGQAVGAMYGFVSDGYYGVDDFDWNGSKYTLKKGVVDATKSLGAIAPGTMKFKDLDNNGIIDESDKKIIGNANPVFMGGLNQQFVYKNFDLSVFVNFVVGNDVFNANKIEFTNGYTPSTNLLATMNNRWRTIDDNGKVITDPEVLKEVNKNAQLWTPKTGVGAFFVSSWAIEDGSFLRINNISLGYTLPQHLLSRAKISKLRFYCTLNNLAVLTHYTGYDPEVNTRRAVPVTPNVDYAAYPRSHSYIAGINLSL